MAALLVVLGTIRLVDSLGSPGPDQTIRVEEYEYGLRLDKRQVPSGTIEFEVENTGHSSHTFGIKGFDEVAYLAPGDLVRIRTKLTEGRYVLYCTVPEHEVVMREEIVVAAR